MKWQTFRMRKNCHFRNQIVPMGAFAITALILCGVFAAVQAFPFGEHTLAWGDMSQQVIPLLMEWKDILAGKADMFLNLQNAGGMSFWGVFFFFLSSPFSFLVVLVEKAQIYLLVNVLVLIKLSLASAVGGWFFQKEAPALPVPAHLALGLSYGLCGYGLLYYQNLVWLDMLCLFPLLMGGFLRIMEGGGSACFTVVLTMAVIVNYYLSYMVFLGILLCGGIFLHLCVPKEKRGAAAGKLGRSALTALLLTAVVWLPSFIQCMNSARTSEGVVSSLQAGNFWARLTTTLPVLLISAGAAAAPWLYRLFPQTAKSKAIAACWSLTVLPMLIEPINKLWHTGSYQAFPARYGYMPVFFGLWYLALGLKSRQKPPELTQRRIAWIVIGILVPVTGSGLFLLTRAYKIVSGYTRTLWISPEAFGLLAAFELLGLAGILLCFTLWRWGKGRGFPGVLLALCVVMSGVQSGIFIGSAANTPKQSLALLAADGPEDPGLYRIKPEGKFCHVNLLGGAGFPALSHYTSLTDSRFLSVMKKLGYSSYWMEVSGCCGTAVSDILLSNKYTLTEDMRFSPTGSGNLGLLVPEGALPEKLKLGDRLAVQNQLAQALTGENAFTQLRPIQGKIVSEGDRIILEPGKLRYEIEIVQPSILYFDAFDCISTRLREKINDAFSITINGKQIAESYPTQYCNGILQLGKFNQGTVTVEITVNKRVSLCSFGVWALDVGFPASLAAALPSADLRCEGGKIAGTADGSPGRSLFLSVPWYQGMEIHVNGSTVQPRIVLDCFMEIPLPEDENLIEISYVPAGFRSGLAVSAGMLGIICLFLWLRRYSWVQRVNQVWQHGAAFLLDAAFVLAILAVYVFPVVIWLAGKW